MFGAIICTGLLPSEERKLFYSPLTYPRPSQWNSDFLSVWDFGVLVSHPRLLSATPSPTDSSLEYFSITFHPYCRHPIQATHVSCLYYCITILNGFLAFTISPWFARVIVLLETSWANHYIPIRMADIKNTFKSWWWHGATRTLIYYWWECKMAQQFWKETFWSFSKS